MAFKKGQKMKNKQLEYNILAKQLQKPNQLDDTGIAVYSALFEHSKVISILFWVMCAFIGGFLYFNFDVNALLVLLIMFGIRFGVDIYVLHKQDCYKNKLTAENEERDDLRKICSDATSFRVDIILKTSAYSKKNKQADVAKAKKYYNHISLFKVDDGWIFYGRRPVYLQKDLTKESEIVFVHETDKFIKNDTTQVVMFPVPKKNSSKQIYAKFYLSANDEHIKLEESYMDHTELKRNECALGDVFINIDSIKDKIYKRIVSTYQPYNYACNSTKPYTPERQERVNNLQKFRISEEFAKLKFAPLAVEEINDVSFTHTRKNSYSHKYNEDSYGLISGAIHTYETDFFIINIFQGQTYQGVL